MGSCWAACQPASVPLSEASHVLWLQNDLKSVKHSIVRLMRMLIQVLHLLCACMQSRAYGVTSGGLRMLLVCCRCACSALLHVQVCTTLEPLPPERYIFMKLTYTEDTPEDYEPAGFRKYESAEADHYRHRPFMMCEMPSHITCMPPACGCLRSGLTACRQIW